MKQAPNTPSSASDKEAFNQSYDGLPSVGSVIATAMRLSPVILALTTGCSDDPADWGDASPSPGEATMPDLNQLTVMSRSQTTRDDLREYPNLDWAVGSSGLYSLVCSEGWTSPYYSEFGGSVYDMSAITEAILADPNISEDDKVSQGQFDLNAGILAAAGGDAIALFDPGFDKQNHDIVDGYIVMGCNDEGNYSGLSTIKGLAYSLEYPSYSATGLLSECDLDPATTKEVNGWELLACEMRSDTVTDLTYSERLRVMCSNAYINIQCHQDTLDPEFCSKLSKLHGHMVEVCPLAMEGFHKIEHEGGESEYVLVTQLEWSGIFRSLFEARQYHYRAGICSSEVDELAGRDYDFDGHKANGLGDDGSIVGQDCDDADYRTYPDTYEGHGTTEINDFCKDGIDNNCDGQIDSDGTFYFDGDKDGYGDAASLAIKMCADFSPERQDILYGNDGFCDLNGDCYVKQAGDCDDSRSDVNPGEHENCFEHGNTDSDCDGDPGNGCTDADGDGANSTNDCDDNDPDVQMIGPFWLDNDNDGDGDPNAMINACSAVAPEGYSDNNSDCDDSDPETNSNAGEDENDAIDNDCDGIIDEGSGTSSKHYFRSLGGFLSPILGLGFMFTGCSDPAANSDYQVIAEIDAQELAFYIPGGEVLIDGFQKQCLDGKSCYDLGRLLEDDEIPGEVKTQFNRFLDQVKSGGFNKLSYDCSLENLNWYPNPLNPKEAILNCETAYDLTQYLSAIFAVQDFVINQNSPSIDDLAKCDSDYADFDRNAGQMHLSFDELRRCVYSFGDRGINDMSVYTDLLRAVILPSQMPTDQVSCELAYEATANYYYDGAVSLFAGLLGDDYPRSRAILESMFDEGAKCADFDKSQLDSDQDEVLDGNDIQPFDATLPDSVDEIARVHPYLQIPLETCNDNLDNDGEGIVDGTSWFEDLDRDGKGGELYSTECYDVAGQDDYVYYGDGRMMVTTAGLDLQIVTNSSDLDDYSTDLN